METTLNIKQLQQVMNGEIANRYKTLRELMFNASSKAKGDELEWLSEYKSDGLLQDEIHFFEKLKAYLQSGGTKEEMEKYVQENRCPSDEFLNNVLKERNIEIEYFKLRELINEGQVTDAFNYILQLIEATS